MVLHSDEANNSLQPAVEQSRPRRAASVNIFLRYYFPGLAWSAITGVLLLVLAASFVYLSMIGSPLHYVAGILVSVLLAFCAYGPLNAFLMKRAWKVQVKGGWRYLVLQGLVLGVVMLIVNLPLVTMALAVFQTGHLATYVTVILLLEAIMAGYAAKLVGNFFSDEGLSTTQSYVVRRLLQTAAVWLLIITLNFFIFRVMPGDPRATLLSEHMSPELTQTIIARFGLDRPLVDQYLLYIWNLLNGDLGYSFSHFGEPVMDSIFSHRFANTVLLMGASLIISTVIGMVMGVIAAARRDSKIDTGSTVVFLVAFSIPVFWLGLLLLLFFGFHFDLIPIAGTITRGREYANFIEYALDYGHHMIGPTIVLTLSFIGGFYLIMRDSVLDVFTQDYMLAARAKGLKERTVLFRHAMRNAMLPMVSVIAVNLPYLISGATMTEFVFSWEGLGLLTYDSVLANDLPVLQGIFLFLATITVIANFLADMIYLYLDPRIRY